MTTHEMELFAGDPLNPGSGYTFRTTANGEPVITKALTQEQAREVMRVALEKAIEFTQEASV